MKVVVEKAYELMKKEYNRQREENISLRLRIGVLEKEIKRLKEEKKKEPVTKLVRKMAVKEEVKKKSGTVAEKLKALVVVKCKKKKMSNVTAYLSIYQDFCKKEKLNFDSLYKSRMNSQGKVTRTFLEVLRSENLIDLFEKYVDKC